MSTPCSISNVPAVCRPSWTRVSRTPASLRTSYQSRQSSLRAIGLPSSRQKRRMKRQCPQRPRVYGCCWSGSGRRWPTGTGTARGSARLAGEPVSHIRAIRALPDPPIGRIRGLRVVYFATRRKSPVRNGISRHVVAELRRRRKRVPVRGGLKARGWRGRGPRPAGTLPLGRRSHFGRLLVITPKLGDVIESRRKARLGSRRSWTGSSGGCAFP